VRGAGPPIPVATDLRVAETGPSRARAFGAIAAEAFGLPPEVAPWFAGLPGRPGWSCLVALDGDEPVAAGALYAAGGAGWLALGATRPAHRGRGAQPALIAARIRRAAELGCRLVVAETGAAGPDGPGALVPGTSSTPASPRPGSGPT
jgi:GNAT superfamily N-acetyltransferase